jgi:hypothetical protein
MSMDVTNYSVLCGSSVPAAGTIEGKTIHNWIYSQLSQ